MMDAKQQQAENAIVAGRSVFLTGGAGTGKTRTLSNACARVPIARLGLTGSAAALISGQTVHSFFGIPPRIHAPNSILNGRVQCKTTVLDMLSSGGRIAIDEVSMMRIDLFQAILETIMLARRRGGGTRKIQLIASGDFAQLPPVVTSEESGHLNSLYGDRVYAFEHRSWKNFEPHVLTRIHRQGNDAVLAEWLAGVRRGVVSDLSVINSRVGKKRDGAVHLVATNAKAKIINDEQMKALRSKEIVFSGVVAGIFDESSMRVPHTMALKPGARVIICANDASPDRRYHNGSTGTLLSGNADKRVTASVRLDDGRVVTVIPHEWEKVRYEKIDGEFRSVLSATYKQMPLLPGWAITIHRSQGMTLDNVHVDTSGVFASGQTYVALSRAVSLDAMTIETPVERRQVMVDQRVNAYHDLLDGGDVREEDLEF